MVVIDIQRGCSQRDSLSLYIYIFFDGAGILATQIQHIIINKVSTYYISLVSPSSINSFSMGEFFF